MTKDKVTTITTIDGNQLVVYMPTMGDFEAMLQSKEPMDNIAYNLSACSVGMTLQQYRDLPVTDGLKILNAIIPAIDAMTMYMEGITTGLTMRAKP